MSRSVILTKEGFEKITNELEYVKTVKVPYAENRVKTAKEYGDKAEIKDAQEERKFYQQRIPHLQNMLDTARLLTV